MELLRYNFIRQKREYYFGGVDVYRQRILQVFSVVEEYLKRRQEFINNLIEEKQLKAYFINSNVVIIVLSAVYGTIMGLYAGGLQILYDAVKIPMLLLISLYTTAPSFYVLTSLLGGKRSLSQVIVLLLSCLTVMSTILIALIPVNLFFILTTPNTSSTEPFIILLNVLIFALAGIFALVYLLRGFMALYPDGEWFLSFIIGGFIFVFVGTQLAWVLRPYFNYRGYFIGPVEKNFYIAVIELIFKALRGGR